MNTTYKFGKKFFLTANMGISQGAVTIQTNLYLAHSYSMGGGCKLFGDRISISASASNFLNKTWSYSSITTGSYFSLKSISTTPFKAFAFTVSWAFGKLKENVSKKKGVVNDDLL
jgi:hypothetical protein